MAQRTGKISQISDVRNIELGLCGPSHQRQQNVEVTAHVTNLDDTTFNKLCVTKYDVPTPTMKELEGYLLPSRQHFKLILNKSWEGTIIVDC